MSAQDSQTFEYAGPVSLACQEGGYVAPAIMLGDIRGRGLAAGIDPRKAEVDLAEKLEEVFAEGEPTRMGDQSLGLLRIVIERVTDADA